MREVTFLILTAICMASHGQPEPMFQDQGEVFSWSKWTRGIAVSDFDNDGDQDIYLSTPSSTIPNALFVNQGDGTFIEKAATMGLSFQAKETMALWVDLNDDGWLDLYVGINGAKNKIFINQSGNGFMEKSVSGLQSAAKPNGINAGDFNGDGHIDLHLNNLVVGNELLIHKGNMVFEDQAIQANCLIKQVAHSGLCFDMDRDQDLDILLAFDVNTPLSLLENDGLGVFNNSTTDLGIDFQGDGMGLNIADLNFDGVFDFYVTNRPDNALFISQPDGTFIDQAPQLGVDDPGMGWGVNFIDFDNDGYEDIYVANETSYSDNPNMFYRNNGDLTFTNVADELLSSVSADWATTDADLNNDGKEDLLIANSNGLKYFRNETANGNWIQFILVDMSPNRFAIGALIEIAVNDKTYLKQVLAGDGYYSQSGYKVHVGLGNAETVDEVRVSWPDGTNQSFNSIATNKRYLIRREGGIDEFDSELYKEALTASPLGNEVTDLPIWIKESVLYLPDHNNFKTADLLDLSGKWIRSNPIVENQIDLSGFHPGIYLIKLQGNKESKTIRFRLD